MLLLPLLISASSSSSSAAITAGPRVPRPHHLLRDLPHPRLKVPREGGRMRPVDLRRGASVREALCRVVVHWSVFGWVVEAGSFNLHRSSTTRRCALSANLRIPSLLPVSSLIPLCRLKNEATLTNQALAKLNCKRRILLSGTPMQVRVRPFFATSGITHCDLAVSCGSEKA